LLSTSFLLLLAAVERASFVSAADDEVFRRAISDPGSDLLWHAEAAAADSSYVPQPIRLGMGANILVTQNLGIDKQNADILAPPFTDGGLVKNMKSSMAFGRNGLLPGGYSRVINIDDLPQADDISGGNLRQTPGTTRVLHWHNAVEWGYVITGANRVTCVTPEGQAYVADVPAGDIWNFPKAYPHSIQAKNVETELIIAFDLPDVRADSSWTLQDWLAHTPKGVVAKNFGWDDPSLLDQIPTKYQHSYNYTAPVEDISKDWAIPNNAPNPFTHKFSQQKAIQGTGGSVKIVDSNNFKVATTISTLEATISPGHMRELHWHPYTPQWTYFVTGEARMTVYAPGVGNARTFNYVAGDIGYVPKSYGHYIENTGNTTLKFLEITKADHYSDVSAQQWMALVPPSLIKGHFGYSDAVIAKFNKKKLYVV